MNTWADYIRLFSTSGWGRPSAVTQGEKFGPGVESGWTTGRESSFKTLWCQRKVIGVMFTVSWKRFCIIHWTLKGTKISLAIILLSCFETSYLRTNLSTIKKKKSNYQATSQCKKKPIRKQQEADQPLNMSTLEQHEFGRHKSTYTRIPLPPNNYIGTVWKLMKLYAFWAFIYLFNLESKRNI